MESIEITAKSPDEGRKLAAEKLGVSPDQVEITVLEETKGLFGRMSYRLSASTNPATSGSPSSDAEDTPAKPKATRSRAKKAVDDAPVDAKPKVAKAAAAPKEETHSELKTVETAATPAPTTGSAPRRLGRKLAPTAPELTPAPSSPAVTRESEEKGSPSRLGRKPREEKPKSDPIPAPSAYATNDAGTKLAGGSNDEDDAVQATDEDAERYRSMLQELLQTSGLDVELHVVDIQGKYVNLRIDDAPSDEEDKQGDASYLIGRSGEVLNALQYLANLIGKQQFSDGVRVVLDGNDWREKREEKAPHLYARDRGRGQGARRGGSPRRSSRLRAPHRAPDRSGH